MELLGPDHYECFDQPRRIQGSILLKGDGKPYDEGTPASTKRWHPVPVPSEHVMGSPDQEEMEAMLSMEW